MIIDQEKLITLLTQKTGMERVQVEAQLGELVARIKKAASENKNLAIEGFGIFSIQNGELHFNAGDRLETEVNNKYAGMKPIELIGAFKESETGNVPAPKEEELQESVEQETALSGEKEEEISAQQHDGDHEITPPIAKEENEKSPEKKENIEKVEHQVSTDPSADTTEKANEEIDREKQEAPILVDESKQKADTPPRRKKVEQKSVGGKEKEKDTLGTVLVTLVIIVALGVGGWAAYDMGLLDGIFPPHRQQTASASSVTSKKNNSEPTAPVENNQPATPETKPQRPENSGSQPAEPDTLEKVTTKKESETKPASNNSGPYGLKGEVDNTVNSGYMIVVHSLRSSRIARQKKQLLESQDFRVIINRASVGGTTYYRVGLGQFKSVADAREAIKELPQKYRDQNFIKRFK